MVANKKDAEQTHLATLQGRFEPATTANFARIALGMPFSTLGVSLAIHWQALKLWVKGAAYHSKPKQIEPRTSIATDISSAQARSGETVL